MFTALQSEERIGMEQAREREGEGEISGRGFRRTYLFFSLLEAAFEQGKKTHCCKEKVATRCLLSQQWKSQSMGELRARGRVLLSRPCRRAMVVRRGN